MTMTDERLAELDALLAKAKAGEWERDVFFIRAKDEAHASDIAQCFKGHRDSFNCATANAAAIVALHNAYPDLRAHIDAQAATIARQDEALNIAHTAFADCDQSNPMQVEAIAIVRATLTGDA